MLNWLKKLFGLKHKITVRGDEYDRYVKSERDLAKMRVMKDELVTAMNRARLAAGQTSVKRRDDVVRRSFDATADGPPMLWPILTDGLDVSERAIRGMDSMAASIDPVSSGGGGNFSGGGASGDWGGGSDSSSSSSDSSSSSSD